MSDPILIPDLDTIETGLLRHAEELDYLVLDEVVHRQRRLPIARVQFAPLDLMDYLDALNDEEDTEEEPEDSEDEGEDEVEPDEDTSDTPTVERTRPGTADPTEVAERSGLAAASDEAADVREGTDQHTRLMCRAVLLWIVHEVRPIMKSRPICTFRLRMYKPKGVHVMSKNFKVENPSYRPPGAQEEGQVQAQAPLAPPPAVEPAAPPPTPTQLPAVVPQPLPAQPQPVQILVPAPPPPAPPPPLRTTPAVAIALGESGGQLIYLDPDTIPEARVWRALGRATEDFLGTVGRTFSGIIDLQTRTVEHQALQLDKSQALVENLAGQLLAARQVQRTDEVEERVDEQQLRVREELGKTFLSELGSLGRVLASSKLGVTPELVELGDIVSASPELAEAVRDPAVRSLLKDNKTTRELAQLLRLAAHKANSGAGTPPQAA